MPLTRLGATPFQVGQMVGSTPQPSAPRAPPPGSPAALAKSGGTQPPAAPPGQPDYSDYFTYANGGGMDPKDFSNPMYMGTPAYTGGWVDGPGASRDEGGSTTGQVWKGGSYKEAANVPDKYKGLLSYEEKGDANGPNAMSGFKLNADVIKKLPITKFGTVDNVERVPTSGSRKLKNPNLKYYDPHYGWITPKTNLYENETGVQKYAVPVMQGLASAAFGGVGGLAGAGMGAWTGGAGALAGAAQGLGDGASLGQTLLRIAPALIGAGMAGGGFSMSPEMARILQIAKYGKTAYDVHQGITNHDPFKIAQAGAGYLFR